MEIALSFCFFLLLMIVVGMLSGARKGASSIDYLMAGRRHGKLVIALSGAASATSGFIMIGAVGSGYTMGIVAVMIPLSWFIGDALFWSLFPDRINRFARDSECNTVPEFISYVSTGMRDGRLRKLLAVISIIFVGLYAVGQFLAAGKAVNAVFDISLVPAILISGVVILAYSVKGGLQSSIPTQFVQALIMLFTTIGMFILAVYIGGGPTQIAAELNALDPDLLSLDGGHGALFMILIILGFSSAAFAFDVGQPQLLVRIMATKSPEEAAKARWIYLGFMQITWISMTLFGVIMSVLLPDIADPEQALPIFARENLPPLLAGATMAGIFAAVASTLDGQLLVLSSSIGVDLSPRFYRRMIDRFGVQYQEWVTAAVTVILAVASIAMIGNSTVFTLIVFSATALGVSVGCAMFISLSGWRTSAAAISTGLLAALLVAIVWRHMGFSAYLLEALPAFLTGLLVHWVVVKMTYKIKPTGATA